MTTLAAPCAQCGQPIPAGAQFCPDCGAPTQIFKPTELLGTAPSTAADGPFSAGHQIGTRYTVIRLLGTGGMGAVYQAFDHELGVGVAIKVIRPAAQSDATAAKDLEQRFKRELVLARQITHKHVVRIHDIGDVDGVKYLTMPFIEGQTLAELLRKQGKLSVPRVVAIAKQIAQGLAAAHDKGVIHRDLKPENIMIEKSPSPEGGDALIMDFGIARSVQHGGTQTAAGSVVGTLEYMAPEQALGQTIDQRADIYAFGLIVYDMLVGRRRLQPGVNPMSEMLARVQQAPSPPNTIDASIPEALDAIVRRCLQPSRDDRYATTIELLDAVERLTPDGRAGTGPSGSVIVRHERMRGMAIAAVVLMAIGVAVAFLVSRAGPAPTAPIDRDPISILIADFENKTGDPVLDGVVEQALGLGVEGASFITAYPRRDALRAAAVIKPGSKLDESTALLVARREGVGLVIGGGIEPSGGTIHITARAVRADSDAGRVLYSLEVQANGKAQVLETIGQLAGQVRTALGDTAVPKAGPAASETFTAASLEAARAYAQAQELQWAGKIDEAMAQYLETIKLDPEMGRAYSGLAAQYANIGRSADAEKYYQEALARADRMTDREKYRTRGSYFLFARKPQEAVREYEGLVKAYPSDSTAMANLAFAHSQLRHFDQARAMGQKASAMFPLNVGRRNNAALYAMYAGQFETAISESDDVLKLSPTYMRAFLARALSEIALRRLADAVKTYERLKDVSAAGASYALAGLADVALFEGRVPDAIKLLQQGIATDTAAKNTQALARKHVALADAHIAAGDLAAAAREAESAIAIDRSDPVALTAGLVLARARKTASVSKLIETLSKKLEADPQAYAHLILAEGSLAQKQPRAALDHLKEAEAIADTWLGRVLSARAHIALGNVTEAKAALDNASKRSGEATAIALDEYPTFHYFAVIQQLRSNISQ